MMNYIRWIIIVYMPIKPIQRWLLSRWFKYVEKRIPWRETAKDKAYRSYEG